MLEDIPTQTVQTIPPTSTPIPVASTKPKGSILKLLVFGCIGVLVLIFVIIAGLFYLSIKSALPTKTPSSKIESPSTVFVENNKLYIFDKGRVGIAPLVGGDVQETPKSIWIFELPTGKFLNQYSDSSSKYKETLRIINKYAEVNGWKLTPLKNTYTYIATSSASKKTYISNSKIVEGIGAVPYVDVYSPENKKLKELNYNTELLVDGPKGNIYLAAKESTGVYLYKLDSNSDNVLLKEKLPIKESTLGIQIDFIPFVSNEGIYLLPADFSTGNTTTEVLVYNFTKDSFSTQFKLSGQYSNIFAKGSDLFLSGKSGVIWVDKNSGNVVKNFTGK